MDRMFKVGVSDWTLYFETGDVVGFSAVLNHMVSMSSDKMTNIRFTDVCFDLKFLSLFKNGVKLNKLQETFWLTGSDSGKSQEIIEYEYFQPVLKNVAIHSMVDGMATATMSLVCG